MDKNFYKPLDWTPELVGRFWDYWSGSNDQIYFGKMFGPVVVSLAEKAGWLREPILDVGCGPGHVLEMLASRGLQCSGVDWSADSIESARNRCQSYPSFNGVTRAEGRHIGLPDGEAETVLLMEVLEHLLDNQVNETLDEISRLLRPGGRLIVTVPSAEDLSKSHVGCPNCGSVFHRIQHVRSLSEQSLPLLLRPHGFQTEHIRSYNFGIMKESAFVRGFSWLKHRLRGRELGQPHLLCVAVKERA